MKKVIVYLILSSLASTSYSQNWEKVGEKIKDRWGADVLYVDSVNDYLYVGGGFYYQKADSTQGSFSLIRLKNGVEEILDSFPNNWVRAIYPYQGDIYVGGHFSNIGGRVIKDSAGKYIIDGGENSRGIARLHNDTFEVVNPIMDKSVAVHSFTEYNGKLIVGGAYDSLAGFHSKGVLAYDGKKYSHIGGGVLGKSGSGFVYSLNTYNGSLFAGGNFSKNWPKDKTNRNLQVYSPSSNSWGSVDGWQKTGTVGNIISMKKYKNELYIAGYFLEATGDIANCIVKYDGQFFYSLGDGIQDNYVSDMVVFKNQLFVVGDFSWVENMYSNSIVKWDGTKWCTLSDDSFKWGISAVAIYHDTLHILGGFDTISGQPISTLAKWIGNPNMEDSCAAPAKLRKVNYNLGISKSELTKLKFNIYPNPVTDFIVVEKLKNAGDFNYTLLDINGKVVKKGTVISSKTEIEILGLNKGMYILEIFNNHERTTKKILIE